MKDSSPLNDWQLPCESQSDGKDCEPLPQDAPAQEQPSEYSQYSSFLEVAASVSTVQPIEDAAALLEKTADHIFLRHARDTRPECMASSLTHSSKDNGKEGGTVLMEMPQDNGNGHHNSVYSRAQVRHLCMCAGTQGFHFVYIKPEVLYYHHRLFGAGA